MGCGFSTDSDKVVREASDFQSTVNSFSSGHLGQRPTETILEAFTRLDGEILTLENTSPGSRLTTSEAWIEHLDALHPKNDDHPNEKPLDVISELDETILDDDKLPRSYSRGNLQRENDDMLKLAVKLQVAMDIKKAGDQEEFLAKIGRGMMEIEAERLRMDLLDHARKRADYLIESFNRLRNLYLEQDSLIASISGGTYSSSLEQELDSELETAREIRDRLSGVAEQWRTCSNLLVTASKAANQAYELWCSAGHSKPPSERIQLALDVRNVCQSASFAVDCANQALPQVEIPFITNRQLSAVQHALYYILTDLAAEARYNHTKNVLESFKANITKAAEFIEVTYKKSLELDLKAAIDSISVLTLRLRKERIKHFKGIVGSKLYVRKF